MDQPRLLSLRMAELCEEAIVTRHNQRAGERGGVGRVYHNQLLCLGAKEKKKSKIKNSLEKLHNHLNANLSVPHPPTPPLPSTMRLFSEKKTTA